MSRYIIVHAEDLLSVTKLTLLLIVAGLVLSCNQLPPTVVEVQSGLLQGEIKDDLLVFKGIPFAEPPVGELRWKAPQPVANWEGIKQATEYAPSPYQPGNPASGKSEDCLYLNIWTPSKSKDDQLPVMVWIYGGGFSFGTTADPVTTGEKLARKGVVVVSIAYRVGQLGFLAHPELSAENPNNVSGNYGLLDQIAGLQWIQDNIAAFGGDPDKVTIFGESAGGISVSMLCASPLAEGLFGGAISQSGGSFGPTRPITYPGENMKTLTQAEAQGKSYEKLAGATSLAELRSTSPDSLPLGMGMGGAWPITDGYVIPDNQHVLYQKGDYNDVPVLIGYNSDEGASFTRVNTPEAFISSVRERYGKFADTLLTVYPVGENTVPKTARDLARDAAFGWHTWSWAELQSQTGKSPVYYYYFDQHPDYPEDSPKYGFGSPHGQDVAYVFKTLDEIKSNEFTEVDSTLSETMVTYWTNFAKYGDPNGEGVPKWSAYSHENADVMYLDADPNMGPVPDERSLKVLDAYFKWRITTEGKLWVRDSASRVVEDGGTGKYSAIMQMDWTLPTHTIFRPNDLSAFDSTNPLPIIAWGNGACANSPWEHVNFLSEVASHGFLVIAIGPMPAEGEQTKGKSKSLQLLDAIDWAIAQNGSKQSPYYQKIDTENIAVSGMSCGGLQTLEVAGDPRVSTIVVCNSGILPNPGNGMPGMPQLRKDHLEQVHTPTLYLLGGESDIAYNNGMDDYNRIDHVPIFVGNMDVGHGGTYSQPHGGEFAKVVTAWYKWQLKEDLDAGKLFTGSPGGLSQSALWTVEKKNMP